MLTPQQIEEARKKIGLNVSNPSTPTASTLLSRLQTNNQTFGQDITGDFKQIGKDIISGSGKRSENIQAIKTKLQTGEKGNVAAIFETAGQLAGSGSDAIAAATKGAVKMVLGPKSEQKVKELVQGFGQQVLARPEVHKIVSWYEKLPDDKKDALDAVGGFASLAADFVGLDAAKSGTKAGINTVKQGAEQIAKTAEDLAGGVKKVTGEIIPSTEGIVNYQVTRALDLTQGDVKNISMSTGNEVGEFLAKKNLIAGNKDETVKMVQDFADNAYTTVRDEISKVPKSYKPSNIPRYTESLKAISKQVDNVPGLEKVSVEVENLLNKKGNINLMDVQRVKELLDEHFNLYKVTGDVKEGAAKEGLSNLRSDLKQFIEKEVKDTTGSDIASLNNDVSTSKGILEAVAERSTRGLTTSNIKLGDLGIFGVGSAIGSPLLGAAAVVAKKIVESSAIRLKIARYLDKIGDARKLKIKNALIKGEMPDEIVKIVEPSLKVKGEILPTNLISEAKKYKSAEDFVKAQGTPVYHGSSAADIIEKEGFKKMPNDTGVSAFGDGSYLTTSKSDAKGYGGGKFVNVYLPKNLKLKSITQSDAYTIKTKKLIEEGYNGTILKTGKGDNIVIFNRSLPKTKSQLTNIWNKSNK